MLAYTQVLGMAVAARSMTSIRSESTMILSLNRTSFLYFVMPLVMRLVLTVLRKYQFRAKSNTRKMLFSVRSQAIPITVHLSLICI
jgi:hypothetical protein